MIRPLTSLRFFFALLVFFSHLSFLTTRQVGLLKSLYTSIFSEGTIGVSFFFILSGFILALNYEDKLRQKSVSHLHFWIARFARIYPLHLVTLLVALPYVLHSIATPPLDWLIILGAQLSLTQSFVPLITIYYSINGPAWSICDEAFFYLLFPFLIKWLAQNWKIALSLTILFAALLGGMQVVPEKWQHWAFYISPFARISDFMLGIVLYRIYRKRKDPLSTTTATMAELASVILMIAAFSIHSLIPLVYRYSVYYWLPMSLVVYFFSFQKGLLSSMVSVKPLVWLGEISFAFYLIHLPVILYTLVLNNAYGFIQNDLLLILLMLSISIGLAFLLHKYIELPANRFIKARLIDKRSNSPGKICAA